MREGSTMNVLERDALDLLFTRLKERGLTLVGPTVRERAIVYDEIFSAADLPWGWTDRQEAGTYRLERRADDAAFGFTVGPHAWKRFLFPPVQSLFRAERAGSKLTLQPAPPFAGRYALIGVRACEIAAIDRQDKVFLGGPYVDSVYKQRREGAFVVAVQCGQAGGTCFCASMGTGPRAGSGFDLALTEVLEDGRHWFLVEEGSQRGTEVVATLPVRAATAEEIAAAGRASERAEAEMGRTLDTEGLRELFLRNYENRHWDRVAERCLGCGNCTMVCPTCFCATVDDVTDLAGQAAERVRRWDSCFTIDFSYLHGGSVRSSIAARYRQWITHKLATWTDQFGAPGCVGCGRCITWCPVGIDLTEEARALRALDHGAPAAPQGGAS
jgi:sulfhydrogenase subunit beta (sulfur reductase)